MAIIAFIAVAEAVFYAASRSKRNQTRRQQILMGNSLNSARVLPLVDTYLKRKTMGASNFQVFVSSRLAEVCRRVVHTRSFEFVLLHAIRKVGFKRRSKSFDTKRRFTV